MSSAPAADELEALWKELDNEPVGPSAAGRRVRRVLLKSSHHCFVGVEHPSRQRVFSVVADDIPAGATNGLLATAGVMITSGTHFGVGTTVDLVLRASTHSDIFTALVADLLVLLSHGAGSPGRILVDRLVEWQRMLASVGPAGLTPERQRGLFGELHTLSDLLLPTLGSAAVPAWTGPDQDLQDFQFESGSVEVKTVAGHEPSKVRINSERQLDATGPGRLFLVTLALDARRGGRGTSLPELVAHLRRQASDHGVHAELDQRLVRAGYLDTQSHLYLDRRYVLRQRLVHSVAEGFPRITEGDTPSGVSNVSYTLDLLAATPFLVSPAEMTDALDTNV
ncbi:MAG: PD-(D/E)XK motif protein [Pseudonocardiaceae bacterium]